VAATQERIRAFATKRINPLAVLVTAAMVMIIRQPLFFTAPRIWAEEGTIYLFHALVEDPTSSFLTPHLGYYSLFNKIAIYVASQFFHLQYAAFVTTGFSAALQLCTCLVIYVSVGRLGRSKLHRFILSLLPLLVAYPEVWLNTINAHFWLATGTYFVLNSIRISVAQMMYLFFAFTTGGSSLFFLPYFILRAAKEKTAQLWTIVLIGTTATVIQSFALYSYFEAGGSNRLRIDHLSNLAKGMFYTAIIPFQVKGAGLFFVVFMVFAIYKFAKSLMAVNDRLGLAYSLVSLVTYTILVAFTSLSMNGGSRYGLPVHCGLLAMAFCGLSLKNPDRGNILYAISLALVIVLSAFSFFDMNLVYSKDWPDWQKQIQARSCHQTSEVLIFPQWKGSDWRMLIPKGSGVECQFKPFLN
jgi:hypothetical protein